MQNLSKNSDVSKPSKMGLLERAVYRSDWLASHAYRRHLTRDIVASIRLPGELLPEPFSAEDTDDLGNKKRNKTGFAALRVAALRAEVDDHGETVLEREAPAPGRTTARLLLARLFDANPEILASFASEEPITLVDVPDAGLYNRIAHQWRDVLALRDMRFVDMVRLKDDTKRGDFDAIFAVTGKPLTLSERGAADGRAYIAVQLARPILAITPSAETHLSRVLLDGATKRVALPPIDGDIVRKVIRIVTGRRCTDDFPDAMVSNIGLHELLLSVRFDRSPAECVSMLARLAKAKIDKAGPRDLSLDQLHGLDDAVAWARSTAIDLEAWKHGKIGWGELDAGIVLDGPPGVGKTLFARAVADHFGLPLVSATYAKWQAKGHLGDLLRAMKEDFEEARRSPCVFFIDELDSFADRNKVTHDHKDYVVSVVNGFIEQIDGLQGRAGIVFVGATNDVRRCDPAIVRAGRFNRVIKIGLPSPADIEKIMRVRLRGDLVGKSIEDIALLALGSTGADVERIVKDARRRARQDGRQLSVADLRIAALGSTDVLSPDMLARASIHEAGHIVVTVMHDGPEDVQAVVAGSRNSAGFVMSRRVERAGTLEDHRRDLQRMLAGRAAEEMVYGDAGAGDGSGGLSGVSDLAAATKLGAALVASFGHSGPHPLVFLADYFRADVVLDQSYLRAAVQEELKAALDEAKRILAMNADALKEVAARLRIHGRIDGHDVRRLIEDCGGINGKTRYVG